MSGEFLGTVPRRRLTRPFRGADGGLLCASWRRLTHARRDAAEELTGIAAQDWAVASADPQYRAAVVDLLGALAYGELAAFERLAEDAKLAPTLADKAELAKMASAEFHHFEQLRDRLTAIESEPTKAMEPFAAALDEFHRQTAPSDWLEGLVKAYVGDSIASDFYREVAVRLDSDTRRLVLGVLDDTGHGNFAVEKVRAAIEADPRVGGRLALWARRLMGEALSQAQRVVAERDALSTMLVAGSPTASTWRRSVRCSPGSPRRTRSGWPPWGWRREARSSRAGGGASAGGRTGRHGVGGPRAGTAAAARSAPPASGRPDQQRQRDGPDEAPPDERAQQIARADGHVCRYAPTARRACPSRRPRGGPEAGPEAFGTPPRRARVRAGRNRELPGSPRITSADAGGAIWS